MTDVLNFLVAAVLALCPLLLGTLGETLTEKSGNLNLGVEGMMFMGGVAGLAGSIYYEKAAAHPVAWVSVVIALVCAFLCAAFGAFLYSVLTISLRANQNVTGLALTIFGTGFGNFFGELLGNSAGGYAAVGDVTKGAFNNGIFPGLANIPVVGKLLFSYNFMVYLSIALALVMAYILYRTRTGLNLRAVGEKHAAADAAGVNVTAYKYLATCVGGGISGLGGLYIVMNSSNGVGGVWVHNCIAGYGWLSVALVIFATWHPSRAILCALIFGGLSVMRYYFPVSFIPSSIYEVFPYIATIVVLVSVSMRRRRKNQPPASLGLAYFREER
ncbi:nucleoside ABC transporter membrane protein [Sporobacter termitidis DSM 10068]|uniref:Nucleoside ABC transporter membrane protein n=1 Tax=Sporobacter termitidis DSM 10068 TaxID=1123282 RepID=A0A1M5YYF2_9FIRM|nr:ABC transporter permease [Sporobacter termitidis]SHI16970.1 nucleoside ABC transporter membrane protein [Sporobacter termitidis DSM 10068]